jgi:hypothetical protein
MTDARRFANVASRFAMRNASLIDASPSESRPLPADRDGVVLEAGTRLKIAAKLARFLESTIRAAAPARGGLSADDLDAFARICDRNPAAEEKGSTRTDSLLWLFAFCRCLRPEVIVESGVRAGRSLWTLRNAAPDAVLYAYDIRLDRMAFRDESIRYRETDWSRDEIRAKSEFDLCYFDDHINNCLRIQQARERGFRNLVFDDAPSVMNLGRFRFPGVPTAQMILDDDLEEGDAVVWTRGEETLRYTFSEAHTYGARDLIERIVVLPDLVKYTGRDGSDHLVYVRLK